MIELTILATLESLQLYSKCCVCVCYIGNCIAATGALAVPEWLDIPLLVSSGPSQRHQH